MATEVGELAARIKLDTSGLAQAATEAKASIAAVGQSSASASGQVDGLSNVLRTSLTSAFDAVTGAARTSSATIADSFAKTVGSFQRLEREVKQAEDFLVMFGDNADRALSKMGSRLSATELRQFVEEGKAALSSVDSMSNRTAMEAAERVRAESEAVAATQRAAAEAAARRAAEKEFTLNTLARTQAEAAATAHGVHSVGEAFAKIKRDVDVFGGAAGASFANVMDDAFAMVGALGGGGVLGAVSALTIAVGIGVKAWETWGDTAEKEAQRAAEALAKSDAAFASLVEKMKTRRVGTSEGDLSAKSDEVAAARAAMVKAQRDLGVTRSTYVKGEDRRQRNARLEEAEEAVAVAEARHRNLTGELNDMRRAAFEQSKFLTDAFNAQQAKEKHKADMADWWSSRGQAPAAAPPPALVKGTLMAAADEFAARVAEVQGAASAARVAANEADREHWQQVRDDAVKHSTNLVALRAAAEEAERKDAEDRLRSVNEIADAGRAWFGALRQLFNGDVTGVGSASLISGTFNTGVGFLDQVDNMKFDGAANALVDGLNTVSDGLGKAGSAMVKEVFNIADLVGQLPTEVMGAFTNIVNVFAQMFEGVMSAVQDNLSQMRKGFDDVMAGTVGLAFNKALGGGGMESAFQNSMSVGGGFAGMGLGAAGLFVLANPLIAGALAVFGALVVFLNPVLALGAAFVAMVPAVVAIGAGLLQLSTQSASYAEFQRAMGAVTQKAADAMGPLWRQLLPLTAVLSHVVDGMGAFFQAFIPSVHVARALFEAAKLAGMGVLNLNIGMLKLEDAVLRSGLALIRLANSLGADISTEGFANELTRVAQQTRESTDARNALDGLTWGAAMAEGALLGAANAASAASEQLTNVPSGYRVALGRFNAQDAMAMDGGGGTGPHANHGPSSGGGAKSLATNRGGNVVNINLAGVSDPQQVVRVVLRELERVGFERGTGSSLMYGPALMNR